LAVPSSNDDFCLALFMIMPNDFVCCVSELEFSKKKTGTTKEVVISNLACYYK